MSTKATPPILTNSPSPFFRKNDYESAIWKLGYDVEVSKACVCPCQSNQNSPLLDCQNCMGLGWFWINPIQSKAIIHSINLNTKIKEWSIENIGTASLTLSENLRLSFMDKVEVLNSPTVDNRVIYSEVLTLRGSTGNEFVFLSYKPVEVLGVQVFNGSSKRLYFLAASTYSIETDNEHVLKFDFDFSSIDDFNNVITVLYKHSLQYFVVDVPHDIRNSFKIGSTGREEQIVLPVNAIIRKSNNVLQIKDRNGEGLQNNDITLNSQKWILENGKWLDTGVFKNSSIWKD